MVLPKDENDGVIGKKKRINFFVPKVLRYKLRIAEELKGKTASQMIRDAVEAYLKGLRL